MTEVILDHIFKKNMEINLWKRIFYALLLFLYIPYRNNRRRRMSNQEQVFQLVNNHCINMHY